jgi:hypothetical protein
MRINLILEANENGLFIADSFERLKQHSLAAATKFAHTPSFVMNSVCHMCCFASNG